MIKFENVNKHLGAFSLQNISFELPKGYIMGVIGENGAGKTSLLNLILSLYQPDSGRIEIFNRDYKNAEREIRNDIGYVLQDEDLFLSNVRLIDHADMIGKYYTNYDRGILLDYCGKFSLNPHERWKSLSKGEKLKFQFVFAIAHQPKLLVLDEPTANFDPDFREKFLQVITEFISDGEHNVILATHQLQELEQIADYITFLHQGRLIFSVDKETLFDKLRIVKGETYKVNLLRQERVIHKEVRDYATTALVRHRRVDTYDNALAVNIPTIEEIMYHLVKSGKVDGEKKYAETGIK